jgi:hypothetical protein
MLKLSAIASSYQAAFFVQARKQSDKNQVIDNHYPLELAHS